MPTSPIALPPHCDRAAAELLLPELVARMATNAGSGPVIIDGSPVMQIGQAMLQLLLATRRSGAGAIISASTALRDAALLCGLSEQLFDDPPT